MEFLKVVSGMQSHQGICKHGRGGTIVVEKVCKPPRKYHGALKVLQNQGK
jgi:hypothetical protein